VSLGQDVWLRLESVHSWLSYKRLEVGVFKLPRVAPGAGSVELRASELAMLLDGIDMAKLKRVPRYERAAQSAVKRAETIVA
jgi:transposase